MTSPLIQTTGLAFRRHIARAWRSVQLISLIFFMAVMGASSPNASPNPPAASSRHEDQVMKLIVQMADQAQLSSDAVVAARAQAWAGLLLLPYDREQARAIFRRAFQPLMRSPIDFQPASAFDAARRQQLRVEFLDHLVIYDPEMADTLARSFVLPSAAVSNEGARRTPSAGLPPWAAVQGRLEAESRELLVSVAMQMAEVDKERALALARMSLAIGVSPYFDRLLMRLDERDPALADQLFSDAVDYLQHSRRISPNDAHTLSLYLMSAVGSADKDRPPRAAVVRFLNLACDLVMSGDGVGQVESLRRDATDSSFQLYCTGKYLLELLPRYLPARAAQIRPRLAELGAEQTSGPAGDVRPTPPIQPDAIEQAARKSAEPGDRDELYAKTAFGWLANGELQAAQQAATNIASREMRDRVLVAVARRLLSKARNQEAMQIVPLLADKVAKTELLVRLAQAASALRNSVGAKSLLELAEFEALKIERPAARARLLLAIVTGFAPFDSPRAFAAMQEAVNSLNAVVAGEAQAFNPEQDIPCALDAEPEGSLRSGLAGSLTSLARADYDRALLLAQQLAGKDISVIAQLAVCQGGLRPEAAQRR
ncbi:MAG TPA: hypothetical protein VJ464_05290 [Blastocatellia bacterium]|nr:hypothetical protein [Blastocatellia bacterium]